MVYLLFLIRDQPGAEILQKNNIISRFSISANFPRPGEYSCLFMPFSHARGRRFRERTAIEPVHSNNSGDGRQAGRGNAVPPLQQAPRKSPRPREGRGTRRIHSAPASRKQGIKQHQRQIGASGQQQPARLQIPCLSQENRQHRKDGIQGYPHQEEFRQIPSVPGIVQGHFPTGKPGGATPEARHKRHIPSSSPPA